MLKRWVLVGLLLVSASARLRGQAMPPVKGPGGYVAVGLGGSGYQFEYGQRQLGGIVAFADFHATWRYGVEGEVRSLRYHTDEDVTETTYMAGPHVSIFPGPIKPYVKLLAGAGDYSLPFHFAQANYFTYAPGAGVDVQLTDYIGVRVIDFEYQVTPGFRASYNEPTSRLVNYGVSAGITVRVTPLMEKVRIFRYKQRPYGWY